MVRFTNNVVVRIDSWYKEVNPRKSPAGKEAAMPGPVPARCTFPDDFLQERTRHRSTAYRLRFRIVQRFRLVLLFHEQPSLQNEDACGRSSAFPLGRSNVGEVAGPAGDFSIEDRPGRGRKPAFSPSGSSVDPCPGV